jgi:quercetin dioxygenase-like cupin family protein
VGARRILPAQQGRWCFDHGANVDQPFLDGDCYNCSRFTPISTYPCIDGSPNYLQDNEEPPPDMERSMKPVWLVAAFFPLLIAQPQAKERKDVTVTELLSTTVTSSGQPIVLPQKDAQIVVSIYDVAPGAILPVHKHPYPRYGYVLSGELRVTNMETGQNDTYKPGDFVLESVGQWHMGANIGGKRLKLLVIDIVEKGQMNTVVRK